MGLWEDYRNETGESPYIEMTLYEGEIEDSISDEYADWVESKVKKLEAKLDHLSKENDRKNLYINKAIHYLKRKNIYEVQFWLNHALNAEQGGE